MRLNEAETRALVLMKEHGLLAQGWRFKFDNAKKRFGHCIEYSKGNKKIISLSKYLTQLNNEEQVVDTILHEIAHALVGTHEGHNRVWRQTAREIGCTGTRCYSETVVKPQTRYTLICPKCDLRIQRDRLRSLRNGCPDCCKKYNYGRYCIEYEMIVQLN